MRIFVVDDEPNIADTLTKILGQQGLDAVAFTHPRAALEAAQESPPDGLISDVVMPGMNGVQLAMQIEELNPRCVILLRSGQAQTCDLLSDARKQGKNYEILAKPISPVFLLSHFMDLIDRRGSQLEEEASENKHEVHLGQA
jgi:DNA-binding NtrC family response regulator